MGRKMARLSIVGLTKFHSSVAVHGEASTNRRVDVSHEGIYTFSNCLKKLYSPQHSKAAIICYRLRLLFFYKHGFSRLFQNITPAFSPYFEPCCAKSKHEYTASHTKMDHPGNQSIVDSIRFRRMPFVTDGISTMGTIDQKQLASHV